MNNYYLRRLRYAMNFDDKMMLLIFRQANFRLTPTELKHYLRKEDDENFVPLPDYLLVIFLDGFILFKRGKKEGAVELSQHQRVSLGKSVKLTNNLILNKMKIALGLKSDDLIELLSLADFRISKAEMSAFFRKPSHRNYRECGNQLLRNLLTGITLRYRDKK
ncbi:MAG: DUF1456 family protein [Kangiellaceae bacterium]|nr:DUF1456 family protein [Kangiellaceae bacterium]